MNLPAEPGKQTAISPRRRLHGWPLHDSGAPKSDGFHEHCSQLKAGTPFNI